mgnify:FL=1
MANYTRLNREAARSIVSEYGLEACGEPVPLDGGQANSSFLIPTEHETVILSVCDEKNLQEIDTLTRILLYLEQNGFPGSRVLPDKQGGLYREHEGKPVYLKRYIKGRVVQDLSLPMTVQVGRALAQLHALPPPEGTPRTFAYGFQAMEELLSLDLEHPFLAWLHETQDALKRHIDPDVEQGFIHGDLFWDNLVFEGETLAAVLDFEEACSYYTLFDLGMSAVGCCSKNGRFDPEHIRALLRGYGEERDIPARERSQLPYFMEYAAAATALWRFRQYTIRYPLPDKADTYREMVSLADEARDLDPGLFSGK